MGETGLVQILEGALMAAGEALSLQRLSQLFVPLFGLAVCNCLATMLFLSRCRTNTSFQFRWSF